MSSKVALYSAVGDELTHYEVDVERAVLTKRDTISVPANVQYAWPHPSKRYLYVATSNRGSSPTADLNHLSAYRIDPATGALALHGEPRTLRDRAVHICVDLDGRHVLSGHNLPRSGITVNRIEPDGTLGPEIAQSDVLEFGPYPHQVMVTPSGRTTILIDRGNSAEHGKPEDPGALRLFGLKDGVLSSGAVVAPNGGYGFGPRHLDFHPEKPWLYVSDERRSKLYMFRMAEDSLEPEAAYTCDTLADPQNIKRRQLAGAIHVHPNGRYVYVMNRADALVKEEGQSVFGGGENSIAVYAIDQQTGEPTLIQHADTHAFHVRTFSIDPGGALLVAGSIKPLPVRVGGEVTMQPAVLSVSRVGSDGKLELVRTYGVGPAHKIHYWSGMLSLD